MRRLAQRAICAGLAAIALTAASAALEAKDVDLAVERAAVEQFLDIDQRLQNVGWKLVRANAQFCERTIPSIGLQLQDTAIYGEPDLARRVLELDGNFSVATAAKGSPAAQSGAIRRNREVTRLGTIDPNGWSVDAKEPWRRLTQAHDAVDAILLREGAVNLTFGDGQTARFVPVTVCAARFELIGKSEVARSQGQRVMVGVENKALQFDESEFAAMVAHELAHTLLDHTAWRDRNGRAQKNIRLTEREADRLMPWLLANAGYDPRAAARFFEKFRPPSGSVLFFRGSHNKWRDRVKLVEDEIVLIERVMASEGKADWSVHFRREIDPLKGLDKAPEN